MGSAAKLTTNRQVPTSATQIRRLEDANSVRFCPRSKNTCFRNLTEPFPVQLESSTLHISFVRFFGTVCRIGDLVGAPGSPSFTPHVVLVLREISAGEISRFRKFNYLHKHTEIGAFGVTWMKYPVY